MSSAPPITDPRAHDEGLALAVLRDLLLRGSNDDVSVLVARLVALIRKQPSAAWVIQAAELLQPLWQAAMEATLAAKVMHLDLLALPVLEDSKATKPKLGLLRSYVGDEQTALHVYTSVDKKPGELGPEDLLSRRQGYVVAADLSRFGTTTQRQTLLECGCNLQARRYFTQAQERGDTRATHALAVFQQLYRVEDEIRACSPEAKVAKRQELSRPAYDDLMKWCRSCQTDEPRSSPLGRAIHYLLDHEAALRRFLDDGAVPIDNGIFERLHVRLELAGKSALLVNGAQEGHPAAVTFTLLSCCQLSGVNPIVYLADVLPRLSRGVPPAEVAELLPARWKRTS